MRRIWAGLLLIGAVGLLGAISPAMAAAPSTDSAQVPFGTPKVAIRADADGNSSAMSTASHRGMTMTSQAAKNGARGFDINAMDRPGFLRWGDKSMPDQPFFSLRLWVQVVSAVPGQSVEIFTLTNSTGQNSADLFLTPGPNRWRWDVESTTAGTGPRVQLGTWYLVEAKGGFAAGNTTLSVRLNGQSYPPVVSKARPGATVKGLWLGSVEPRTHRQFYDDITLAVSDQPLDFLPATDGGQTSGSTSTVGTTSATSTSSAATPVQSSQAAQKGLTKRWATILGASLIGLGLLAAGAAWQYRARHRSDVQTPSARPS